MSKIKVLLRSKVWFPGLDSLVETSVKSCISRLATTPEHCLNEPLVMTEMYRTPWTNLAVDFYGPLPSNEYLLVVIDEHSRYPIVEVIHSTPADTVIPVLDKVFSMFGLTQSFENRQLTSIAHYPNVTVCNIPWISPREDHACWPQANSEAER